MSSPARIDVEGFDEVWRVPCGSGVAFVALHAVIEGIAFGGIRIASYDSEDAACADACALAHAMSRKLAVTDVAGGGAKSALVAPPEAAERARAVAALGRFIQSLGGRYHAGPDLGFGPADERVLRAETDYLASFTDLAEATADGVHAALTAVAEPRRVAVEGLGSVGGHLARRLRSEGVEVLASDVRPVPDFDLVPVERLPELACDVFAPCARGERITAELVPRLGARVVCGAANNVVADLSVADALHARGIDLVPDFVANAGAVLVGASRARGEEARVAERLAAIGPRAAEFVRLGRELGRSPQRLAVERADARLAERRD